MVTNLAMNARDAMDGGQLNIALSGLNITADLAEQPAGPHVNAGISLSRSEWSSYRSQFQVLELPRKS